MDSIYKVYIKWLSVPAPQRTPKSKDEFKERYKITDQELFEFQERKTFGDDLNKETMLWAKRRTPEMMHTLFNKYQESKAPQDLKVWQDAIQYSEENAKQTSLEELMEEFKVEPQQLCDMAYRILEVYDPHMLTKPKTFPLPTTYKPIENEKEN
jgi:hypothetical protein